MDAIKSGLWKDNQFWGHDISQKNKWKLDENGKPLKKNGKLVPRFFGASTFLVMTRDGWHLTQFFTYNCLIVGCLIFKSPLPLWLEIIAILTATKVLFEVTYNLLKHARIY